MIKGILMIIGTVGFCFAFVVTVFAFAISGYEFGESRRRRRCKHEYVKISHKAIRKEGKYIVKRTKWRCKKCGKVVHRE